MSKRSKVKKYKSSKKTALRNKLYWYLVNTISERGYLPKTTISKQSLQYHLNKLKLEGVIYKKGHGVWEANKDKLANYLMSELVKKQGSGTKDIRGHGFQWKIELPNLINWYKRKDYLDNKNISYIESKANWIGQRILVRGYKVWLLDSCIIIYSPKGKSFLDYSAEGSFQKAKLDLFETLKGIENKLGIDLKFEGVFHAMPSKQHYGKVRDTLAKFCNKNKEKISVKNDNGEWFIIDNSFNLNESETVHKDTAIDDMDRIGKPVLNDLGVGVAIVMNDVKEHYEKTGETLTLSKILQVFNQQQQIVSNQQEQILQLTKLINEMSYKSPESLKPRDSYFG